MSVKKVIDRELRNLQKRKTELLKDYDEEM